MTDLSHGAAWMGGDIRPISEASIHVTDWGLTHSDIAYDVVPLWKDAFFRLPDYLARFEASCTAGRFDHGLARTDIETALHEMVGATGFSDSYVAMVAARGRNLVPGSRDPRDCDTHF